MKFTIADRVPVSGHVPIVAISNELVTPNNALTFTSYESSYPGNVDQTVYSGDSSSLPIVDQEPKAWQLVVTDKLKFKDQVSRETVLLPYQYQLMYDHYAHGTHPSGEIEVCYANGDTVKDARFDIEYATPTMWYDLHDGGMTYQRYNRSLDWEQVFSCTGSVRLRLLLPESLCFTPNTMMVRYNKVLKSSSGAAIDLRDDVEDGHMEVINPEPVYAYTDDYTFSGTSLVLAAGTLIGSLASCRVKRADINRIRVELPDAGRRQGWFPRVRLGSFETADGTEYYVPDAWDRDFGAAVDWASVGDDTFSPLCGLVSYDESVPIGSKWVQLKESPLYFTTTEYPHYRPYNIHDGFHHPLSDVGTNSNHSKGINVYVDGSIVGGEGIDAWDFWNARIRLVKPVMKRDIINVTYLYKQRYYTMQVPDVNPQMHHIIPPTTSYLPAGDSVVIVLLPGGGGLAWYWKSANSDDTYDGTYNGYSPEYSHAFPAAPTIALVTGTIKLGEFSIKRSLPHSMLSLYDPRYRGGGIYEDGFFPTHRHESVTREDIQVEADHYADVGLYDGQGLKKDGVLVIEVPFAAVTSLRDKIIDDIRGVSEADAYQEAVGVIKSLVSKNVATGVFFVLVDENGDLLPTVSPG